MWDCGQGGAGTGVERHLDGHDPSDRCGWRPVPYGRSDGLDRGGTIASSTANMLTSGRLARVGPWRTSDVAPPHCISSRLAGLLGLAIEQDNREWADVRPHAHLTTDHACIWESPSIGRHPARETQSPSKWLIPLCPVIGFGGPD